MYEVTAAKKILTRADSPCRWILGVEWAGGRIDARLLGHAGVVAHINLVCTACCQREHTAYITHLR